MKFRLYLIQWKYSKKWKSSVTYQSQWVLFLVRIPQWYISYVQSYKNLLSVWRDSNRSETLTQPQRTVSFTHVFHGEMFQIHTQTHVCCCFSPHLYLTAAGSPQSTRNETLQRRCRDVNCVQNPLHPDSQQKVRDKQTKQKQDQDGKRQVRSFQVGDAVWMRNFSYGHKWIDRVHCHGDRPVSFPVMLGAGKIVRRHVVLIFRFQE